MSSIKRISNKAIVAQLIATLSASISGIANGMQSGWTAPIVPKLQMSDSPIKVTETDIIWLESLIWVGSVVGLPITIYCLNNFGRKMSTLIAAVQNLIAWLLIATAPSVEFLYVSRFITGIATNNAFVSTPIYIAEIADKRIRGFLGTFTYTTMLLGIIVVYSVAPFVSLAVSSAVGASFLIVQLFTFPFMPETPYYLLLTNKKDKAERALQMLRADDDIYEELEEIGKAVTRQKNEKGRMIDLIKISSNRKALIIMTMLNFTQHFSGISVTIMNIHSILEDVLTLTPNTASILFSVLMMVSALSTSAIIDRLGRKFILGLSSFLTGLSLFVIGTYFAVKSAKYDLTPYTWILVCAVMMYAVSFKCGLGLVPIVMTAELFPTNVKAMGVTIADALYVMFGFASINMYQHLRQLYGIHVPFFIFGCCCICAGFFTISYIPETKGKSLEEIQMLLKKKNVFRYVLPSNTSDALNGHSHKYGNGVDN
ncbi:hypothetical protein FQA39_LY07983 [Lamprigera yunnana]|nr:hypothetical protein FQA39_LY07983 [Lamprigera yunnana]